ncbi:MAG TPA: nitroreductase/quinone reductase family protein [Candidatus Xenobia bacterium]|jgi:deazaflavin-dependent oxidoreductase (nitroreductase family)
MPAVRKSPAVVLFWKIHPWLYRVSGGLIGGRIQGMPDGERHILIASNAGEPNHPAWYFNLQAHPEVTVQVGREVKRMRARDTEGAEREAMWQKAVSMFPYDEYARGLTRQIPVVALEPI